MTKSSVSVGTFIKGTWRLMAKPTISVRAFIKGTLGGVLLGVMATSENHPFEAKPLPVNTITVENSYGEAVDLSAKEATKFFEDAAKKGETPKVQAVSVMINGEAQEFKAPKRKMIK
jgi:hypothetical protein